MPRRPNPGQASPAKPGLGNRQQLGDTLNKPEHDDLTEVERGEPDIESGRASGGHNDGSREKLLCAKHKAFRQETAGSMLSPCDQRGSLSLQNNSLIGAPISGPPPWSLGLRSKFCCFHQFCETRRHEPASLATSVASCGLTVAGLPEWKRRFVPPREQVRNDGGSSCAHRAAIEASVRSAARYNPGARQANGRPGPGAGALSEIRCSFRRMVA